MGALKIFPFRSHKAISIPDIAVVEIRPPLCIELLYIESQRASDSNGSFPIRYLSNKNLVSSIILSSSPNELASPIPKISGSSVKIIGISQFREAL